MGWSMSPPRPVHPLNNPPTEFAMLPALTPQSFHAGTGLHQRCDAASQVRAAMRQDHAGSAHGVRLALGTDCDKPAAPIKWSIALPGLDAATAGLFPNLTRPGMNNLAALECLR